jgi:hypothetical protein
MKQNIRLCNKHNFLVTNHNICAWLLYVLWRNRIHRCSLSGGLLFELDEKRTSIAKSGTALHCGNEMSIDV